MFYLLSIRVVELRRQAESRRQIAEILLPDSGYGCLLSLFPARHGGIESAPSFRRQRNQPLTRIGTSLGDHKAIPFQYG
jgi:hypothetical protein